MFGAPIVINTDRKDHVSAGDQLNGSAQSELKSAKAKRMIVGDHAACFVDGERWELNPVHQPQDLLFGMSEPRPRAEDHYRTAGRMYNSRRFRQELRIGHQVSMARCRLRTGIATRRRCEEYVRGNAQMSVPARRSHCPFERTPNEILYSRGSRNLSHPAAHRPGHRHLIDLL